MPTLDELKATLRELPDAERISLADWLYETAEAEPASEAEGDQIGDPSTPAGSV